MPLPLTFAVPYRQIFKTVCWVDWHLLLHLSYALGFFKCPSSQIWCLKEHNRAWLEPVAMISWGWGRVYMEKVFQNSLNNSFGSQKAYLHFAALQVKDSPCSTRVRFWSPWIIFRIYFSFHGYLNSNHCRSNLSNFALHV